MSDYRRVLKGIEHNKQRRIDGTFNCIPWGFPRFEESHPGLEQGKYTIVTANSKVLADKML